MRIGQSSSYFPEVRARDRANTLDLGTVRYNSNCTPKIPEFLPLNRISKPEIPVFSIKICETALQYYNNIHGSNYKLVEYLTNTGIFCDAVYLHSYFTAKDTSLAFDESLAPKRFFAETKIATRLPKHVSDIRVMACQILDGDKEVLGCFHCENYGKPGKQLVPHPPGFVTQIGARNTVEKRPQRSVHPNSERPND